MAALSVDNGKVIDEPLLSGDVLLIHVDYRMIMMLWRYGEKDTAVTAS